MTVVSYTVPGCCKARILVGFEGGEFHNGIGYEGISYQITREDEIVQNRIWNEVLDHLTDFKKAEINSRPALIYATTTSVQVNANKVLAEMGWYCAPHGTPVPCYGHGAYKKYVEKQGVHELFPWFMLMHEFDPSKFEKRSLTTGINPFPKRT